MLVGKQKSASRKSSNLEPSLPSLRGREWESCSIFLIVLLWKGSPKHTQRRLDGRQACPDDALVCSVVAKANLVRPPARLSQQRALSTGTLSLVCARENIYVRVEHLNALVGCPLGSTSATCSPFRTLMIPGSDTLPEIWTHCSLNSPKYLAVLSLASTLLPGSLPAHFGRYLRQSS